MKEIIYYTKLKIVSFWTISKQTKLSFAQSDLFSRTVRGNHANLGAYDSVIDRFYVSILKN